MIRIVTLRLDGRRTDADRAGCLADRADPVLSWAAVGEGTEEKQSAYRITAGEWDSGWVPGELQRAQLPAGTLIPDVPTEVAVQIRNAAGDVSPAYGVTLLNAAVAVSI